MNLLNTPHYHVISFLAFAVRCNSYLIHVFELFFLSALQTLENNVKNVIWMRTYLQISNSFKKGL